MASPLDYSRTLFEGGYRYRSPKTLLAVAGAAGMAAVVLLFARTVPIPAWRFVALGLVGLLCGVAVLLAYWAVIGRCDTHSITNAGITTNGRLTPWQDVREFAAEGRPEGRAVRLYFVLHSPFGLVQHLELDRSLSPDEYERLTAHLRAELGDQYPRLKLGGYSTGVAE